MIVIDNREDSELSHNVELYATRARIKVEKKQLDIGDYIIGNICIEAKEINDFLNSLENNRLLNQLSNMEDTYERNILLIHGDINEVGSYLLKKRKITHEYKSRLERKVLGAIASINLNTNVKVIWVPDSRTAGEIVVASAHHANKQLDMRKMLPKKTRTDDARVDLLSTIKGISPKKARALLKEHLSVLEIAMQDAKTLSKVTGIGKATASNIVEIFNNEEEVKY